jgi:hypothetical protein
MPHDPPAQRIYYEASTRWFARSPAETASFLCSMENCAFGHTPWSITNAGHNPPLLIRDGLSPIALDKGGPVLGLLPGADYETGRVDLHIGDVLVLYTDGVVEGENPEGEEYSAKRLARIVGSHLQQHPSELIETIYASIGDFRETTLLADDFTLVVLKRVASETRQQETRRQMVE